MGVWSCCRPWPSGGPRCWGGSVKGALLEVLLGTWLPECPLSASPYAQLSQARFSPLLVGRVEERWQPLLPPQPWDPRRQDKLQTETPKDFWVVAQWADSARRWLVCPSRPPAWLRLPPHPCSSQQLPGAGPWDPDQGCGLGKERGTSCRWCFSAWRGQHTAGIVPGPPKCSRAPGKQRRVSAPQLPAA